MNTSRALLLFPLFWSIQRHRDSPTVKNSSNASAIKYLWHFLWSEWGRNQNPVWWHKGQSNFTWQELREEDSGWFVFLTFLRLFWRQTQDDFWVKMSWPVVIVLPRRQNVKTTLFHILKPSMPFKYALLKGRRRNAHIENECLPLS